MESTTEKYRTMKKSLLVASSQFKSRLDHDRAKWSLVGLRMAKERFENVFVDSEEPRKTGRRRVENDIEAAT